MLKSQRAVEQFRSQVLAEITLPSGYQLVQDPGVQHGYVVRENASGHRVYGIVLYPYPKDQNQRDATTWRLCYNCCENVRSPVYRFNGPSPSRAANQISRDLRRILKQRYSING